MGKVTNNEGKDLQTKLKSTTHLLYFCSWEIANQKEKVGLSWGLFDSEWSELHQGPVYCESCKVPLVESKCENMELLIHLYTSIISVLIERIQKSPKVMKRKWQNIAEVPHKPQLPLVLFSHLKTEEYVRNLFLSQWLHLASTSIRGHLAQFEKKACTHTVHARTTRWKDTNAHTFTAGGPLSSFAVASFLLLCPNWWLLPAWPLWAK